MFPISQPADRAKRLCRTGGDVGSTSARPPCAPPTPPCACARRDQCPLERGSGLQIDTALHAERYSDAGSPRRVARHEVPGVPVLAAPRSGPPGRHHPDPFGDGPRWVTTPCADTSRTPGSDVKGKARRRFLPGQSASSGPWHWAPGGPPPAAPCTPSPRMVEPSEPVGSAERPRDLRAHVPHGDEPSALQVLTAWTKGSGLVRCIPTGSVPWPR